MSTWTDVRDSLEKIGLPLLGGAVGGPAGATIGTALAKSLGCNDTPSDVQQALKTSPDAAVKLATLENQVQMAQIALQTAQTQGAASQVEAVNKTLQTEAMGGSFWQRNHHAYETSFIIFMIFVIYAILPIFKIPVPEINPYVWIMLGAFEGVTAWQRGQANIAVAKTS